MEREEIAENKAKEWALKMKNKHPNSQGFICFTEASLVHLIKKCLLMNI